VTNLSERVIAVVGRVLSNVALVSKIILIRETIDECKFTSKRSDSFYLFALLKKKVVPIGILFYFLH
jgi:hypothetical protein